MRKVESWYLKYLGGEIKTNRERLNVTQEDFGKAVGCSKTYLWGVETGKTEPTLGFLLDAAEFFGVDIASFFPAPAVAKKVETMNEL